MLQARIALRMPWWSLATGFEMVKSIAGLSGDAEAIRQQLDESNISTNLPKGVDVATKTDEQVRTDDMLLRDANWCACE
jgi:hypothetical protein